MLKSLVMMLLTTLSLNTFAAGKAFSFAGHVTLKNDAPTPIQLTLFEGDFQQAPEDEDTAELRQVMLQSGFSLESDIYFSTKNGQPNLIIMLVADKDQNQSILIIDLEQGEKFFYNVSELSENKIISRKAGYSDYILLVTPEQK